MKLKLTKTSNISYYNSSLINIDIQQYVVSVVASQIGNANIESCKAQAIAARTNAYNSNNITDASPQCFNALRLDKTKYPNCYLAVQQTAGQLLYYNNSPAKPASYSQNNGGRTTSSKQRWGTQKPWLIQQDDPYDSGARKGHGVGMSQRGCKKMGQLGKNYKQILRFYYPNTIIKKGGNNMISANQFVQQALAIANQPTVKFNGKTCYGNTYYQLGASGQKQSGIYKCDCRGYIIWTLKKLGISLSSAGTNYMSRNQMTSVNKFTKASQLKPGMLVFKSRDKNDPNYSLPSKYKLKGSNYSQKFGQLDVYHVGIVVQVSPTLVIKHCSGTSNHSGILTDTVIGKWNWCGFINNIEQSQQNVKYYDTATVIGNGKLNLRVSPNKTASRIMYLAPGTVVTILQKLGDWCKVSYGENIGYVMSGYIKDVV